MKNTTNRITLIAILAIFSSCSGFWVEEDEPLSTKRTNYIGSELRTDGYYYSAYNLVYDEESMPKRFLYRNGVVMSTYVYDSTEMTIDEFYKNVKSNKLCWNVFTVHGNTIEFEGWYPTAGTALITGKVYGYIINDSTFHVYKKCVSSEEIELNETYYFKQFSPKPDSTNNFIK